MTNLNKGLFGVFVRRCENAGSTERSLDWDVCQDGTVESTHPTRSLARVRARELRVAQKAISELDGVHRNMFVWSPAGTLVGNDASLQHLQRMGLCQGWEGGRDTGKCELTPLGRLVQERLVALGEICNVTASARTQPR